MKALYIQLGVADTYVWVSFKLFNNISVTGWAPATEYTLSFKWPYIAHNTG